MPRGLRIQFRGDVEEDTVLGALYAKGSGLEVSQSRQLDSADVALSVAGVVLSVAQLITSLWQIHLAVRASQESRAATRASRRPLQIALVIGGKTVPLPTATKARLAAVTRRALQVQRETP